MIAVIIIIIIKVKSTPEHATKAVDGGGWSTPRPGRFTPGKNRYASYRRLAGPQGRSGRVRMMMMMMMMILIIIMTIIIIIIIIIIY
jgi:hypothetical protein